jgi:hypothetical protein
MADGRKVYQMDIKYRYSQLPFQDPPKFTQIWIFGWKKYHLATLPEETCLISGIANYLIGFGNTTRKRATGKTLSVTGVARFFLEQNTKTVGKYQITDKLPNEHKITKWP